MRYVYTILALIIIGLLIYVLWPRERVVVDNSKVKELRDKLKNAENARTEIILRARQDSVLNSEKEKVYQSEIARLKGRAKAQKEKPEVITVLNDNPEVGKYAAYLDSIVVSQDTLISSLKNQNAVTWRNFNQVIAQSDSVNTANISLNNYYLETERKANKQLRRSNNLLKVGIVAVPLVTLGIIALAK